LLFIGLLIWRHTTSCTNSFIFYVVVDWVGAPK
jgi:hypothetical protein